MAGLLTNGAGAVANSASAMVVAMPAFLARDFMLLSWNGHCDPSGGFRNDGLPVRSDEISNDAGRAALDCRMSRSRHKRQSSLLFSWLFSFCSLSCITVLTTWPLCGS